MSTSPQAVGMSWECATSGHATCHTSGCRCMCHYRAGDAAGKLQIDRVQVPIEKIPTPPNEAPAQVCPKCSQPYRPGDKFCRRDGTPLTQPHCGQCGTTYDPSDLYCPNCGAPTSDQITVKP